MAPVGRGVELLLDRPEAVQARERQLGAGHLLDPPTRRAQLVDERRVDPGAAGAAVSLGVLVEQAVSDEGDPGHRASIRDASEALARSLHARVGDRLGEPVGADLARLEAAAPERVAPSRDPNATPSQTGTPTRSCTRARDLGMPPQARISASAPSWSTSRRPASMMAAVVSSCSPPCSETGCAAARCRPARADALALEALLQRGDAAWQGGDDREALRDGDGGLRRRLADADHGAGVARVPRRGRGRRSRRSG